MPHQIDEPTVNTSDGNSTATPPDDDSSTGSTVPKHVNTKPKKSKISEWDLNFDKKQSPKPTTNRPESWDNITQNANLAGKLRLKLLERVNEALNNDKLHRHMDDLSQLGTLFDTIDKVEKADHTNKETSKVTNFSSCL